MPATNNKKNALSLITLQSNFSRLSQPHSVARADDQRSHLDNLLHNQALTQH